MGSCVWLIPTISHICRNSKEDKNRGQTRGLVGSKWFLSFGSGDFHVVILASSLGYRSLLFV